MSDLPDPAGESDAVLAFIRERQVAVLSDAITSLEASSLEDLPRVVHAIHGALGSYQLHEAHELIANLAAVLARPDTSPEAARAAQSDTVAALRALQTSTLSGSETPA
jgi:HPt (histidine-containing phosphotransfer) domain-containing protein